MRNRWSQTERPGYLPLKKVRNWREGARFAFFSDFSVTWKMVVSVLVLALSFWIREWAGVLIIVLATSQMLVAEMFNTAIELLCDYVEPQRSEAIGRVKDVSAAAAAISILVWGVVMAYEIAEMAGWL